MGTIRILISAAALLAATRALAGSSSVPYTFTDGQVISSSQMNADFSAILGYVDALNAAIPPVQQPPTVMINQAPKSPGTTITVDGENYDVIRINLPAFATDTRVWVDYPSQINAAVPPSTLASVGIQGSSYGRFQGMSFGTGGDSFTTILSGLTVNCNEAYNYYVNGSMPNPASPGASVGTVYYSQYLSCVVNVDSLTQIYLYFQYSTPQQQLTAGSPVPEDLSGTDPYNNGETPLAARRSQIQADLRSLLQYVVISPGH